MRGGCTANDQERPQPLKRRHPVAKEDGRKKESAGRVHIAAKSHRLGRQNLNGAEIDKKRKAGVDDTQHRHKDDILPAVLRRTKALCQQNIGNHNNGRTDQLKENLRQTLEETGRRAEETSDRLKESIRQALEETGRRAEEKTEQIKETIRQTLEETEKITGEAARKLGLKKKGGES